MEARNVSNRLNLTPKERKNISPIKQMLDEIKLESPEETIIKK